MAETRLPFGRTPPTYVGGWHPQKRVGRRRRVSATFAYSIAHGQARRTTSDSGSSATATFLTLGSPRRARRRYPGNHCWRLTQLLPALAALSHVGSVAVRNGRG